MAKSQSKRTEAIGATPDLKILVDRTTFDLLQAGKIMHILSKKLGIEKTPNIIEVAVDGTEDAVRVRCIKKDEQGFGYRAPGYPDDMATDRKVTRFTIVPLTEDEPVKEEKEEKPANDEPTA